MEAHNFLTYNMHIGRPVFFKVIIFFVVIAQGGNVVGKGIHPNVNNMLGVKLHWHTPSKGGAGNAEILQARFNKVVHHFIKAGFWFHKVWVFFIVFYQLVRIFGKAEKVSLLLCVLHRAAAVRAFAVHQLAFCPKGFTGGAVFALVGGFINVPLVVQFFKYFFYRFLVIIVCCTDKTVVGNVHQLPKVVDTCNNIIHILLRCAAFFRCFLFNFLAVLVCTSEEHYVKPLHSFIPGNYIGCYSAVAVADVQFIGRIVNWRGNVEFFSTHVGCSSLYFGLMGDQEMGAAL